MKNLEGRELGHFAGSAKGKPKIEVYDKDRKKGSGGLITAAKVLSLFFSPLKKLTSFMGSHLFPLELQLEISHKPSHSSLLPRAYNYFMLSKICIDLFPFLYE